MHLIEIVFIGSAPEPKATDWAYGHGLAFSKFTFVFYVKTKIITLIFLAREVLFATLYPQKRARRTTLLTWRTSSLESRTLRLAAEICGWPGKCKFEQSFNGSLTNHEFSAVP